MIQFPKLKEIFFTKLRDQRWFISDFPNNVPIRQKFSRNILKFWLLAKKKLKNANNII